MLDESRTIRVGARFKPSLMAAIEADRKAKGQPMVEWLERAALNALEISNIKEQPAGE